MITDYHMHLENGTLTMDYLMQFIKEAESKGIHEIGISEHAYHFYETKGIVSKPWMEERRNFDMDTYVSLIEKAKKAGLPVKLSIEMDYTPGMHKEMEHFIKQYPFDYVIGSVHWVDDFGIDLAEFKHEWEKRDLFLTYERYFDQIVTLAESNLFDMAGHLDLVKIFKYVPDDKDFLLEQYDRITDVLARSKTCVEVSTAGLRKPVAELYPAPELLRLCKQKDISIVISSDAHFPHQVGENFDQAVIFAESVGYQEITTFHQGVHKKEPLTFPSK